MKSVGQRFRQFGLMVAGSVAATLAVVFTMLSHQPPGAATLPTRRQAAEQMLKQVDARLAPSIQRPVAPAQVKATRPAADLFRELQPSDRGLLEAGPFATTWFDFGGSGGIGMKLKEAGDLKVWNRYVESSALLSRLSISAVAYSDSLGVKEAASPASPAFYDYLDALEAELANAAVPPGDSTASFPWLIARAHARGDLERARELLGHFASASIAAHLHASDQVRSQVGLGPLIVLLVDLEEHNLLRDEDLAPIASALDATVLSPEEVQARFEAAVMAWADRMKQPDPEAPPLGQLLQPLYNRNVDSMAAAWIDRDGVGRSTIQLSLVEVLSGGRRARVKSLDAQPWIANSIHPRYKELVPWERDVMSACNERTREAQFEVAALRHHLREGRWPASAAEIAADLLPPDFAERTGQGWYLLELKDFAYPVLTKPPDAASRLALDFARVKGRHASSPDELRTWAKEQGRPLEVPPFAKIPDGPMFVELVPNGPAVERPNGNYVIPWEEPGPADVQLIRAAVATAGGPNWARCTPRLRADGDRWRKAMVVLGKAPPRAANNGT